MERSQVVHLGTPVPRSPPRMREGLETPSTRVTRPPRHGRNRSVAPHSSRKGTVTRTAPGVERAGEGRSAEASRSSRYFGGGLSRLALATSVTGDGPSDYRQPVLRRTRRRAGLDGLPAPDPFRVDRRVANLTEPSRQASFGLGREPPSGVPPVRLSQIVQGKASSGAGKVFKGCEQLPPQHPLPLYSNRPTAVHTRPGFAPWAHDNHLLKPRFSLSAGGAGVGGAGGLSFGGGPITHPSPAARTMCEWATCHAAGPPARPRLRRWPLSRPDFSQRVRVTRLIPVWREASDRERYQ